MSQVEPKTKDSATDADLGTGLCKDQDAGSKESGDGDGKGSPTPTITNSRGFTVPAIPGKNGGLLAPANRLGDTNPNAGRTPERLRRAATNALEGQIDEISNLLGLIVTRATKELGPDGSLNNATSVLNQVSKLANTLTSIGPGTKVTNVVENPEWVGMTREAMEEAGIEPELVTKALKLLEQRLA